MTQKLIITIVISILAASCSLSNSDIAAYRIEANAYCQAHTSKYWIQPGRLNELNAMRPTGKQEALIKAFRLSVTSKEMTTIIFDEGGKLSAKEFYPYLQKKIPELTKVPFDCPAIPDFYIAK